MQSKQIITVGRASKAGFPRVMQRDAVAIISESGDRIISNLQLQKLYQVASSGLRGANHHPQGLREADVVATRCEQDPEKLAWWQTADDGTLDLSRGRRTARWYLIRFRATNNAEAEFQQIAGNLSRSLPAASFSNINQDCSRDEIMRSWEREGGWREDH